MGKAKFKVVGAHTVDGVGKGGTVELDEPQASQLVYGGHVKPAPKPAKADVKGDA